CGETLAGRRRTGRAIPGHDRLDPRRTARRRDSPRVGGPGARGAGAEQGRRPRPLTSVREADRRLQRPGSRNRRLLRVVVGADLQAQAPLEDLAEFQADGKGPALIAGRLPVVAHDGVRLDVPTALELVADLDLDLGQAHIVTVARAGERLQVAHEDAAEPW